MVGRVVGGVFVAVIITVASVVNFAALNSTVVVAIDVTLGIAVVTKMRWRGRVGREGGRGVVIGSGETDDADNVLLHDEFPEGHHSGACSVVKIIGTLSHHALPPAEQSNVGGVVVVAKGRLCMFQ